MIQSPWLPIFRAIAAEVGSRVRPLAGTAQGRQVVGMGAGGDHTVYLDQLAEATVVAHLTRAYRSGRRFRLLSEELGARDFGGPDLVLVDPVDGSLNAKQGLPYFAIVLATAEGDDLDDVRVALVHNLATGEEFVAERGAGAYRNESRLQVDPAAFDHGRYEVVQLDAPSALAAIERTAPLIAQAHRLRLLGSAALNLCHTATGGISLQVAPLPVRAFDLAGPLLILREAGGVATDFRGGSLAHVSSKLDSRTTLLASGLAEAHAVALKLLAGGMR